MQPGVANKVTATSFNPSGVNPNTIRGADLSNAHQYLTDYVVDGEPLNMHQDHPTLTLADAATDSAIVAPLLPSRLLRALQPATPREASRNLGHFTLHQCRQRSAAALPWRLIHKTCTPPIRFAFTEWMVLSMRSRCRLTSFTRCMASTNVVHRILGR